MAEPREPTNDDLRNAIKGILAKEDLSSLSSKKVRKMLEELFHKDLADKKQEIDQMLMAMINEKNDDDHDHSDEAEADGEDAQSSSAGANGTNGASSSKPESSDESDDPGVDDSPPRKKQKSGNGKAKKSAERIDDASDSDSDDEGDDDSDAAMARKMQKEEMGIRTRNNRRGVERKPKPTKEPKERKSGPRTGKSLYSQECVLSEELAAVMGVDRMARKDVVSRMWQIFKERNMMDPKNRQYVLCDEQLLKVFKVRKFRAFGMMKFLKNHIKDAKLVTP